MVLQIDAITLAKMQKMVDWENAQIKKEAESDPNTRKKSRAKKKEAVEKPQEN